MVAVSVVMATYNRLAQLRSCLRAISRQTGDVSIQICLVNDGGPSIVPVVAEFPDLEIIYRDEPENHGQVAARSLALQMAEGTVIALCDDDDRWLPSHIGKAVETLVQTNSIWAHSDAELVGVKRGNSDVTITYRQTFAWRNTQSMLRRYNPIVPSSVIYRKEAHAIIGAYDAHMGHYWDWDLWLQLANLSAPGRVPTCQVLYCLDDGGANLSAHPVQMRPYLQTLIAKHGLQNLPSMNFLGMLEAEDLLAEHAATQRVWDGNVDIWR